MNQTNLWYVGQDAVIASALAALEAADGSYRVESFASISEAAECLADERPDVVLISMHSENGGFTERQLRFVQSCTASGVVSIFLYHDDNCETAGDALDVGFDLCWDAYGVESDLFKAVIRREIAKKNDCTWGELNQPEAHVKQGALLNETIAALVEGAVELLSLKETLEKKNKELELTKNELEQFIHTVSHDLKEPLLAVRTFAKMLAEGLDDMPESLKGYLDKIIGGAESMSKQIDGLLAFSRAGRLKPDAVVKSIPELINEIAISHGWNSRKDVKIEVGPDLPAIDAHQEQLRQIFGNLISNGIKYNRRDMKVVKVGRLSEARDEAVRGFKSIKAGEYALFYVSDNGIGMSRENGDAPFELFRRLQEGDEFEGDGAGLAIVKRAVVTLGGEIDYGPNSEGGTTMYFTLPVSRKTAPLASVVKPGDKKRSVAELKAALFN